MNSGTNNESEVHFTLIEKAFGVKLPADLIDFINENKDQSVNKKFNRIVSSKISQELQLWSVMNPAQMKEAYDNICPDADMEQLKLLPFGETLGSPVICVSLHDDAYGSVYVMDWDFGPTRVADSLKDFLSMLRD